MDHDEIKDHIAHFYEERLTEQYSWRPKFHGLTLKSIDPLSANWLEILFERAEVQSAIRGMAKSNLRAQMVSLWHFFKLVGTLLGSTP